MKTYAVTVLLILACATVIPAKEIAFVDTYDQALQIAGDKNQNILMTFYADW